jgi:hypothetical protein
MVFLYLLVINAIMVGMCLGVLLPIPLSGASFAGSLSIVAGAFFAETVQFPLYFPLVAGVLAVLSAAACVK